MNLEVRLDLKTIALHARNAEYNPKVHISSLGPGPKCPTASLTNRIADTLSLLLVFIRDCLSDLLSPLSSVLQL